VHETCTKKYAIERLFLARNMFIKRIVAYSPCNFTKSMEQQLSKFFTCLWANLTVAHYFFLSGEQKIGRGNSRNSCTMQRSSSKLDRQ
jgi:hypothetical protein